MLSGAYVRTYDTLALIFKFGRGNMVLVPNTIIVPCFEDEGVAKCTYGTSDEPLEY